MTIKKSTRRSIIALAINPMQLPAKPNKKDGFEAGNITVLILLPLL